MNENLTERIEIRVSPEAKTRWQHVRRRECAETQIDDLSAWIRAVCDRYCDEVAESVEYLTPEKVAKP